MQPTVTAVILAYGEEPWLEQCVQSVLASTDVDLDVILVDNGCTTDAVAAVKGLPGVRVLTPVDNTGFAGGCAIGAAEATGDFIAFVNSDVIVEPEALGRLVPVAAEPGVGMAMASIRLADQPELMNSAGNFIHYAGLVWSGGCYEPAERYRTRRSVPAGSGACFVMRRRLWHQISFAPEFFAYHEDTELSLRLWQRGLTVEFVPDAVVRHHYEFSRNGLKNYLIERNRAVVVLTTYQTRTLVLLAPMLALTECAILAMAIAGGWLKPKLRGWAWLWQNRRWLARRRRQLQSERTVPDRVIAEMMTARFEPSNVIAPPGIGLYNAISVPYWRVVRRLL